MEAFHAGFHQTCRCLSSAMRKSSPGVGGRLLLSQAGSVKNLSRTIHPPVGVDPHALAKFLIELPGMPNAQDIVHAARLYKSALELIEDRPDTAYLALVSVVESLASLALNEFEPDEAEKVKVQRAVETRAREFGLCEAQAKALALEACKGQRWLKRKFVKFCVDYCGVAELKDPDRVFLVLEHFNPPDGEFENVLGRIYDARSKNLHAGSPFPPGIGIGMSPSIKWRDLPVDPLGRPEIPPLPWFERIVSIAARKFLIPTGPVPFATAAKRDNFALIEAGVCVLRSVIGWRTIGCLAGPGTRIRARAAAGT